VFLLCVIVFSYFCGQLPVSRYLPVLLMSMFISMCDFSIDEQINDDDDDEV